jgi:AcrR family transcriptional regulator
VEVPTPQIADFPHGRVPRALRERQLAELAEELFAERGYAGASMDELARRAGVTKPVVYDLFGSKDGLYRRCLERSAGQLAEVVTAAARTEGDLETRVRAAGIAFLRFAAEHRVSWDILFLEPDGRFASEAADIRRRQAAMVAGFLAELMPGSDPRRLEVLANVINGAFEAVAGWAAEHPEASPEWLADQVVALIGPGLRRFM